VLGAGTFWALRRQRKSEKGYANRGGEKKGGLLPNVSKEVRPKSVKKRSQYKEEDYQCTSICRGGKSLLMEALPERRGEGKKEEGTGKGWRRNTG